MTLKSIKQNFVPFLFAGVIVSYWAFLGWSHFSQDKQIKNIVVRGGDDMLVGASALFAQNASVQLNLEVLGTYASVSGNLSFSGEIMPDGSTCSNDQILKRTGDNDWDCAADALGSVASDSLNFDEFQNPLVLDTNITTTSGSFTWDFGGSNLVGIGFASLSRGFEVRNTVGTTASISGTFWVDAANKKVGIGTPTPDSVLHVLTPSASTEAVKIRGQSGQSA